MMITKVMKMITAVTLVSALGMTSIGCSKNDSAKQTPQANQTKQEAKQETKPQGKIVLKLADVVSTSDPQHLAHEYFAEQIAEKTNGLVEVNVFPNSQLGGTKETIEGLKLSTVQITKTPNANFTSFVPETKILDLPYLFKDREHARRALDGELGQLLKDAAEAKDYKILWFYTPRVRSIYTSVKPINTPQDMAGIKIRVMDSPIMIDTINTMGGNAVPLAFGEVYSALEQKVVDGAENSIISYSAMKHSEVSKYFSETSHFLSPEMVVMHKSYYDALPDEVKQAIEELAPQIVAYEDKIYEEQESKVKEELIAQGSIFNEVDLTAFAEMMKPLYEKYANEVGGMELINKIINE